MMHNIVLNWSFEARLPFCEDDAEYNLLCEVQGVDGIDEDGDKYLDLEILSVYCAPIECECDGNAYRQIAFNQASFRCFTPVGSGMFLPDIILTEAEQWLNDGRELNHLHEKAWKMINKAGAAL